MIPYHYYYLSPAFLAFLLSSSIATSIRPSRSRSNNQQVPVTCDTPTTLWEKHVCSAREFDLQVQCQPRFTIQNKYSSSRGLVVAFHGYSACPDSFDELAAAWLDAGFDVMIPLLPGQGRDQGSCVDNELLTRDGVCAGLDRVDGLPTTRQGYIDFVREVNDIVSQERCKRFYKQVMVAGLSHGGPLATYAVNIAEEGLYDRLFIMNPSYAATNPPLDRSFVECVQAGTANCVLQLANSFLSTTTDTDDRGTGGILESVLSIDSTISALIQDIANGSFDNVSVEQQYSLVQFAVRRLLTTVVENLDQLPAIAQGFIQDSVYSWGNQCELERANGRGGICSFLTLNVLAAHSFAQLALRTMGSVSSSKPRNWQIVTTERDSITRNTLNFQAGLSLGKRAFRSNIRGNVCMYRIVCNLAENPGNECGVPHSMLSAAEQNLQGERYWIEDLIQGSVDFFLRRTPFGDNVGSGFPSQLDDRETCQNLPLSSTEPSFDLSLTITRGIWFRFALEDTGVLTPAQELEIVAGVTSELNLATGQVIPVELEVVSSTFDQYSQIQELYIEVPASVPETDLARLVRKTIRNSNRSGFFLPDDKKILEVEVAGRVPRKVNGLSRSTSLSLYLGRAWRDRAQQVCGRWRRV